MLIRNSLRYAGGDVPPVPVNLVPPSIAGGTSEGSQLTATPGVWQDQEEMTITGQWFRDGTPIEGETDVFYTRAEADIGAVPMYVETATRSGVSTDSNSNTLPATINGLIARLACRNTAGVS